MKPTLRLLTFLGACLVAPGTALGQAAKPNILVIFGDDVGQTNISAYSHGVMGYRTPNIDRIAREGMMFTDYYAEQSCTAGRSAFITGQCTLRTGLSKVGMPGATVGLQARDVTIAQLLKPMGYATGQFGKNHLGDRDEFLPTNHGFDEFFGNLYHLNAEEDPENHFYPQDPEFKKRFGPRGVLRCRVENGKQVIEDTGPLTKKRMETVDDETSAACTACIERQVKAGKPFFAWMNSTRMHFRTHVRAEHRDKPGLESRTEYADGMIEHDNMVGAILKKLDDLGIADKTIVLYTTDNGPTRTPGPTPAPPPSAARRIPTGRGRSASRARSAGRATSSPARSAPTSSAASTGCPPSWPPPATRTSRPNSSRAPRRAARRSRSTSTGTTSSTT